MLPFFSADYWREIKTVDNDKDIVKHKVKAVRETK
jgi:hypothetical protein